MKQVCTGALLLAACKYNFLYVMVASKLIHIFIPDYNIFLVIIQRVLGGKMS